MPNYLMEHAIMSLLNEVQHENNIPCLLIGIYWDLKLYQLVIVTVS